MAKSLWKDEYVVRVYELSKSGMREAPMAKVLGISLQTFRVWKHKKKIFRTALRQGRKTYKNRRDEPYTFREYIFQRLPKELRILWRKINRLGDAKNGFEVVEALLANRGKTVRQHLFLYAWVDSNFSISQAMRKVNLSRATFEQWKKKDVQFAALVDEINWHKKNFFEEYLCKLVAGGDTPATIFANKTMNRDRGYNEKIDIDMNVEGGMSHALFSLEELNLPLKVRKEILKSLRQQKENQAKTV